MTRMLQPPSEEHARPFGSRLDELSSALTAAKAETANSRKYNRERLSKKANAQQLEVGDTVIVAANEPLTLTAKWDHQYEIIRIEGTTHWVRHQPSGKVVKVHREKLRLVDPEALWDDVLPRPKRSRAQVKLRPDAPEFLPRFHTTPQESCPPIEPCPDPTLPSSPGLNPDIHAEPARLDDASAQTEASPPSTSHGQQTDVIPRMVIKRQGTQWRVQSSDASRPKRWKAGESPSLTNTTQQTEPNLANAGQQTSVPQRKLFKRTGGSWGVTDLTDLRTDHHDWKQKRVATIGVHKVTKKDNLCWNCRSPEHFKKDCPKWGVVCWECKHLSHYARECPKRFPKGKPLRPGEIVVGNVALHNEDGPTGVILEVRRCVNNLKQ